MRDRLAVLTIVWHKREYRAVLLIMVFLSLSTSSTLPLVTLYLVDNLHVALSLVGLYFVGEVFVSAGAITMGQAFAALHDVMVRDAERRPGFVNATIRTAFSLGFVLGPLLGSELAALVSFRAAFVVAGCLNVLCLAPLSGLHVPVSTGTEREPSRQGHAQNTILLYVFVGLCTLVLIGTALRLTYLPIDVTTHLGGSLRQYGTVMAISPLAELITMPAAGVLALRFRIGRLFSLGLAVATIE
jgi:SET family sugar efflux transporter-like MFS transporter